MSDEAPGKAGFSVPENLRFPARFPSENGTGRRQS